MCGFIIGFLHYLNQFCFCSICAGARLFLSYFWIMTAPPAYTWVTSIPLHRPGAIQPLSTWQPSKISVPGRQTSLAGSGLLLAHLAPPFHREEEYSFVLSCRSWSLCMNVYCSRPCLQITRFCSNSSSIYPETSRFINDVEYTHPALLHP